MADHKSGPSGTTRFIAPRSETSRVAPKTTDDKQESAPQQQEPQEEQAEQTTQVEQRPPTMGFPAVLYKFRRIFHGDKAKLPRLSKKEVAARAAQAEEDQRNQRREDSICYLRELTDRCPSLTITFVGVKGGAATTTTMVNVASTVADDTRTLVYGADFNPASGTAGARLGKEFGQTISIQEFAAIVDEVKGDRKSVNARLRPTRYGVRVLSADNYTKIPGEQYGTTTAKMLNVLDENCDYLLLDTPNDITTPAARAVLDKTDVIVFTANVREPESLRLLRVSMDTVRELGHPEKVVDSVVVISNTPEGVSLDDYTKYLSQTNLNHEVTGWLQPGEFSGQMLMVPRDPAVALNREVNLDVYQWATYQAYRDVDIAIFEQALKMKSHSNPNALVRS